MRKERVIERARERERTNPKPCVKCQYRVLSVRTEIIETCGVK